VGLERGGLALSTPELERVYYSSIEKFDRCEWEEHLALIYAIPQQWDLIKVLFPLSRSSLECKYSLAFRHSILPTCVLRLHFGRGTTANVVSGADWLQTRSCSLPVWDPGSTL
jgi:hypothetical protein